MVLRDERGGDVLRLDRAFEAPARAWDSDLLPLFSGLDPHGNAIFNARQMRMLAYEIGILVQADVTESERDRLAAVRLACTEGQRPPHRYLWFIGD